MLKKQRQNGGYTRPHDSVQSRDRTLRHQRSWARAHKTWCKKSARNGTAAEHLRSRTNYAKRRLAELDKDIDNLSSGINGIGERSQLLRVRKERGFAMDGRGNLQQKWLMGGKDVLEDFIAHVKKMKNVTVDQVCHFVNSKPLKEDIVGVHFNTLTDKQGLEISVSPSTVHRWIFKRGYMHDRAQHTCNTDDHNKSHVVEHREWYTEELR